MMTKKLYLFEDFCLSCLVAVKTGIIQILIYKLLLIETGSCKANTDVLMCGGFPTFFREIVIVARYFTCSMTNQ
jgi:hypothetical protein